MKDNILVKGKSFLCGVSATWHSHAHTESWHNAMYLRISRRVDFNTQAQTDWHVNILQEDLILSSENHLIFSFIFATLNIFSNVLFFDSFIYMHNKF